MLSKSTFLRLPKNQIYLFPITWQIGNCAQWDGILTLYQKGSVKSTIQHANHALELCDLLYTSHTYSMLHSATLLKQGQRFFTKINFWRQDGQAVRVLSLDLYFGGTSSSFTLTASWICSLYSWVQIPCQPVNSQLVHLLPDGILNHINPISPNGDQHQFSPNDIHRLSRD